MAAASSSCGLEGTHRIHEAHTLVEDTVHGPKVGTVEVLEMHLWEEVRLQKEEVRPGAVNGVERAKTDSGVRTENTHVVELADDPCENLGVSCEAIVVPASSCPRPKTKNRHGVENPP